MRKASGVVDSRVYVWVCPSMKVPSKAALRTGDLRQADSLWTEKSWYPSPLPILKVTSSFGFLGKLARDAQSGCPAYENSATSAIPFLLFSGLCVGASWELDKGISVPEDQRGLFLRVRTGEEIRDADLLVVPRQDAASAVKGNIVAM